MKRNRITLYIDLLFCLVIIPLAIMLLPVDRWITNNTAFLITLVAYVYILYFVYRLSCIPKLFMQKKYIRIFILLFILASITELLTYFPMPAEHITDDIRQMTTKMNIRKQTIWFFFLIVTGFSLAIELTFELFRQIISKQEIEAEKNKAELSLYKAQINPHFLFNTLNTLYALVLSGSEKTESAFVKFSDILRYMYSQNESELIPAEDELNYIRQYVDLQKLRLNHHTNVFLSINASSGKILIPPMILITFVENAFKYGTSSDTDCKIDIKIDINKEKLILETENAVMKKPENKQPGIGISNCRKRLDLLYPERYKLENGENNGIYRVKLEIDINN
ncbi:histidine kinase [Bacteroides sp.]|uniref:sensor histidine kinase n=1 Tax=Bacteroides sp. TaxID=29523 RepID=UPI00258A93C9|nr:histidine kinase [Bacteroides sp.]